MMSFPVFILGLVLFALLTASAAYFLTRKNKKLPSPTVQKSSPLDLQKVQQNLKTAQDRIRVLEAKIEEMSSSEEVTARASLISELVSGISHAIKNNLTIIFSRLSLLEQKILEVSPEKGEWKSMIASIRANSTQILEISQVLGTVMHHSPNAEFESVSLKEIVGTSQLLLKEQIKFSQIEIESIPISDDLMVDCKRPELVHFFCILLSTIREFLTKAQEKKIRYSLHENDGFAILNLSLSLFLPTSSHSPSNSAGAFAEILRIVPERWKLGESVLRRHGGQLTYEQKGASLIFSVRIPKSQASSEAFQKRKI